VLFHSRRFNSASAIWCHRCQWRKSGGHRPGQSSDIDVVPASKRPNWRVLLAIADVLGYGEPARRAAVRKVSRPPERSKFPCDGLDGVQASLHIRLGRASGIPRHRGKSQAISAPAGPGSKRQRLRWASTIPFQLVHPCGLNSEAAKRAHEAATRRRKVESGAVWFRAALLGKDLTCQPNQTSRSRLNCASLGGLTNG
jgi:hypothetical protein